MEDSTYNNLLNKLKTYDFVYVNNLRLITALSDGTVMKMHILNLDFALKSKIDFDYFCLHASNDMFVRKGLSSYITKFDSGYTKFSDEESEWSQYVYSKQDKNLKKIMKKMGISKIIGSQVEGSFYSKEIITQLVKPILNYGLYEIPFIHYQGKSMLSSFLTMQKIKKYTRHILTGVLYAKEEIYFPTLTQNIVEKRALCSYCYINWINRLKITQEDIIKIRNNDFLSLKHKVTIESPEHNLNFFAVKRIQRDMDDPIRIYIYQIFNLNYIMLFLKITIIKVHL